MDIANATTRLRRTFHYPTEDSPNDATPDVLDEEEQEDLIRTLAEQNEIHNRRYRTLLLALPLASSVPYLLALAGRPPAPAPAPVPAAALLLGLTSLASTAFLLLSLPPVETGVAALDSWAGGRRSGPSRAGAGGLDGDGDGDDDDENGGRLVRRRRQRQRQRQRPGGPSPLLLLPQKRSPLGRYLPYLNVGLCAVLVLYGLLARRGGGGAQQQQQFGLLGLGNLPAIVYAVVIVAKLVMAGVDPEGELAALRYDYKGA